LFSILQVVFNPKESKRIWFFSLFVRWKRMARFNVHRILSAFRKTEPFELGITILLFGNNKALCKWKLKLVLSVNYR